MGGIAVSLSLLELCGQSHVLGPLLCATDYLENYDDVSTRQPRGPRLKEIAHNCKQVTQLSPAGSIRRLGGRALPAFARHQAPTFAPFVLVDIVLLRGSILERDGRHPSVLRSRYNLSDVCLE